VPDTAFGFDVPVEPVFYEAPPVAAMEPAAAVVDVVEEAAPPAALEEPAAPATDEILPSPPVKRTRPRWSERGWRTWHVVVASLAALVIGLVIGRVTHSSSNSTAGANNDNGAPSAADNSGAQPSAGSPADRTQTSEGSPGATSAPTTLPGGHAVLLNIPRHTGPLITDHFTVTANRWVLGWAYDCTAQGGTGAFNITVFDGDGGPSKDGAIDQQGAKGSSVVAYASTGERYLSVTTSCVWAVRVTT
jgi:hypothetical protein